MDGNTAGSAGVVADDRRRAADHSLWARLDRAQDRITAALQSLHYGNTQEVEAARQLIHEARDFIAEVLSARAPGEGLEGSEGVHGEDSKAAEVSPVTLDAANDPKY